MQRTAWAGLGWDWDAFFAVVGHLAVVQRGCLGVHLVVFNQALGGPSNNCPPVPSPILGPHTGRHNNTIIQAPPHPMSRDPADDLYPDRAGAHWWESEQGPEGAKNLWANARNDLGWPDL